ncbi:hypothetical protein [Candidatus Nitrotoga sp. M5]|uniref:hypothetical protein n=1 Tax=Candidatus Nitrotoga sp. M5 TaxID=2890409 RepID=UPI001EF6E26E|nr:hypothetical protein [Candidatus Nitrotoga sp. M5]CAH1388177.1 hypothetical protein NTGM5_820005 [Candidatus Nitrotoga sp. M5]
MKNLEINSVILASTILFLQNISYEEDDLLEIDLFNNTDDELFLSAIPSVYSASKYEQNVTNAPASISIVSADSSSKGNSRPSAKHVEHFKSAARVIAPPSGASRSQLFVSTVCK